MGVGTGGLTTDSGHALRLLPPCRSAAMVRQGAEADAVGVPVAAAVSARRQVLGGVDDAEALHEHRQVLGDELKRRQRHCSPHDVAALVGSSHLQCRLQAGPTRRRSFSTQRNQPLRAVPATAWFAVPAAPARAGAAVRVAPVRVHAATRASVADCRRAATATAAAASSSVTSPPRALLRHHYPRTGFMRGARGYPLRP